MALFRTQAALLAIAILLLPGLCSGHSIALAPASGVQPVDLPCHESAPANPDLPNPPQKCCTATHQPEALLTPAQVATALIATDHWLNPLFYSLHPSGSPGNLFAISFGPPKPLSLRI